VDIPPPVTEVLRVENGDSQGRTRAGDGHDVDDDDYRYREIIKQRSDDCEKRNYLRGEGNFRPTV